MNTSFFRRLVTSYCLVVMATLALAGTQLTKRLRHHFIDQLEESLNTQAGLMTPTLSRYLTATHSTETIEETARQLDQATHTRVTLIRDDGLVLADSERTLDETQHMDNHLQRPEVQEALRAGTGRGIRYSQTLRQNMLYVARRVPGGYIRLALSLNDVESRIAAIRRDLYTTAVLSIVLAILMSVGLARRVSRPLASLAQFARAVGQGDLPPAPAVESKDEFGRLAQAFAAMAAQIHQKVGELNRERTQLSAILGSMIESVVAVSGEGRILFLNEAGAKLFQVQAAQAKGKPFLEVIRHSPLSEFLGKALSLRAAQTQEIMIHLPEEHLLQANAVPMSFETAQPGILVILHDITGLRKLERVRQEFVANVSHELKTPLTAIQWYTETLLNGGLEDKKNNREFLQIMLEHAQRLGRLIDDILDLSAIEAKRMPFRFEAVAPAEIVSRLLQGLEPMAQAKKVTLENRLDESTPKVTADREKLAQIVLNLVDNAIKFNKEGGTVELSASAAQGQLTVSVIDNGPGIPPEDQSRVFERFYRVDKARSRELGGTGLGLSIVKHLVEAHHGTLSLESTLGQGSTFRFTIPLAEASAVR